MIKLNDVTVGYKKPVIRNFSTTIEPGRVYGLLGNNGSGKTTLLKTLSAFISPLSGEISYGDEIKVARHASYLQNMFFVPDEIELPSMSAECFIKVYSQFYPKFSKKEFESYVHTLNVIHLEKLNELSFGNKKKFIIAYALACNTDIVLLDEPTNGLDISSKNVLNRLFFSLDNNNRALVISTHQLSDLEMMMTDVFIIKDGEILVDCSIDDLSRAFVFSDSMNTSKPIYSSGFDAISINEHGVDTDVNLRTFYDAIDTSDEFIKITKYMLKREV